MNGCAVPLYAPGLTRMFVELMKTVEVFIAVIKR